MLNFISKMVKWTDIQSSQMNLVWFIIKLLNAFNICKKNVKFYFKNGKMEGYSVFTDKSG